VNLNQFRRDWSSSQKELRSLLESGTDLEKVRDLFNKQHSTLHSGKLSRENVYSYADEVFGDLSEDQMRDLSHQDEHSLVWILWHIARIEDVTMNVLAGGASQIYLRDGWKEKLASPIDHVGNDVSRRELETLTEQVDLKVLFSYRNAVGRGTRELVAGLEWEVLKAQVDPARLDRLIEEGAVLLASQGLLDYWGKRTIAGLLLMPPTRHLMVHLNEANDLRKKVQYMVGQ
jgi:hypothetical protein